MNFVNKFDSQRRGIEFESSFSDSQAESILKLEDIRKNMISFSPTEGRFSSEKRYPFTIIHLAKCEKNSALHELLIFSKHIFYM